MATDQQRADQRRDRLQGVSNNDDGALAEMMRIEIAENIDASGLDARTFAMTNLAACIAGGADIASYMMFVDTAVDAGCSPDDIVGVLTAVGPTVGTAKMVQAAPDIATALGVELTATDTDREGRHSGGGGGGGGAEGGSPA